MISTPVHVETAREATQDQIRRYHADMYATQYAAGFKVYSFDVAQAWKTAIEQWYVGLHSPFIDVLGPVKDALSWFWDNVLKPPLEALFSGIRTLIQDTIGTVERILSGITSLIGSVWDAVKSVAGWVKAALADSFSAIGGAIDSVGAALRSGLEWVYNGIVTAMSAVAEKFVSGLVGVASIFKDVGTWIWNGIKDLASGLYHDVIEPVLSGIASIFNTVISAITGAIYGQGHQDPEGAFKRALEIWVGASAIYFTAKTAAQAVEAVYFTKNLGLGDYVDKMVELGGFATFGATIYTTIYDAAIRTPLRLEAMSKFTPEVISPEAAAEAVLDEMMSQDDYKRHVRYGGFSAYYDDIIMEAAITALRPQLLVKLTDAGLYDEDLWDRELRHAHLRPETIDAVKKYMQIAADDFAMQDGFATMRSFMREGFITSAGAGDRLTKLRALGTKLDRQLLVGTWEAELDVLKDQRALIVGQFDRGQLDRTGASAALSKIMPYSDRVASLLDREQLRVKVQAAPDVATKTLTRSEITTAYKDGVITEDYAIARLAALGYSKEDIGIFMTIYAPKAPAPATTKKKGTVT